MAKRGRRSVSAPRAAQVVALAVAAVLVLGFSAYVVLHQPEQPRGRDFSDELAALQDQGEAPEVLRTVTLARTDGPIKVLFIGDSLTVGLFASTEDAGFRPLLADRLRDEGPVVVETVATAGARTSEVAADVEGELAASPDLVVVELGTNDQRSKSTPIAFQKDYRALLERIEQEAPDAALVCAGIWASGYTASRFDEPIESTCEAARGAFRTLSDLYADVDNREAGRATFAGNSDDFHPDDAGHAAIAARLLEAIKP